LDVLENSEEPLCNYEIAGRLGWPINRVCNRVGELRKKGLVVKDGDKRPGPPTNRLNVYYWRAVKAETLF
jgi:DNA-binding IclR family transcriptional regulator